MKRANGPAVMKRILLYSPDVIGHPRVYCRVIADALADSNAEIVLAMGFGEKAELNDCADLLPLVDRPKVQVIDTRPHSDEGARHLKAEELVRLQKRFGIETTLFIEGDKSEAEFRRIAAGDAPRLGGRNLGIFANTAEWYPGEDSFTGEPRGILAPTLRTTLGNIKRAVFERAKSARHFYENVLLGTAVLDDILVKDERLAGWYGPPVYWMPEISRPASLPETTAEAKEFRVREAELRAFAKSNPERELVLYFGDASFYKGYDLFLRYVASTRSVCAVHAGRSYDPEQRRQFRHDVDVLRGQLKAEGRLLETNAYVHTKQLKDLYFGAVRLYLTTHRLALSSSTIIQALEMGKPVLVPDRGLLGYRVRTNNLGAVYEYENLGDLSRMADLLWGGDLTRFKAPVRSFWQRFSDEAIREFFRTRLLGIRAG